MKRVLIVIAICIVVLALIGTGVYFIFFHSKDEKVPGSSEKEDTTDVNNTTVTEIEKNYENLSYLKVLTRTELNKLAESQEVFVSRIDEKTLGVYDLLLIDKTASIIYQVSDDSIEMIRWSYDICSSEDIDVNDEADVLSLKSEIDKILVLFSEILGETIEGNFIYAKEGYRVDVADNSPYTKLLTGETIFDLSIGAADGTLWNARTFLDENKVLSVNFYHAIDSSINNNVYPDIMIG